MSQRRRRNSFHEIKIIDPVVEEREPKTYITYKQPRRTVTFRTTTVHRRHKERIERSPSPRRPRERIPTPSPPPSSRRPLSLLLNNDLVMSPSSTPAPKPGFVPLPEVLPKKEDEKTKKEKPSKERPKPYIKHKPNNSFDTGYASGYNSPWSVEDRSPEQYSPGSRSPRPRPDTISYETVDGKSRPVKYIIRDGKRVRYVSRNPSSPVEEEYVPGPPALLPAPDPYKTKYRAAKETTEKLQQALAEENETAKHNFNAAKQEEAAKLSSAAQIENLEARLRALMLSQKVLEDRVVDADAARKKAEQKLKQKELEKELAERKLELKRSEENLKRRQWDEIEASPSPVQRRRPALPVTINQEERVPGRRATTTVATTRYGQANVTAPVKSPTVLPSANPFMDAIFEAQRDEDRRRATEVKVSDTRRITRERERERDRSKRNSFHD